jgi:hypothetical protein
MRSLIEHGKLMEIPGPEWNQVYKHNSSEAPNLVFPK